MENSELPSKLTIPDINGSTVSEENPTESETNQKPISAFQANKNYIYDLLLMIFMNFITPILFITSICCFLVYYIGYYVFDYELPDHFLTGGCILFYLATCNYCYFNKNYINQENQEANNI